MKAILYRNARGRDLLDAFLISAITSLLLLRFYLDITGYPQIGGGPLHIAHILYGGLFMMVAIVIMLAFLGIRARQAAAVIGGVGFGMFIDELGKFITEDNNYFFRPAIGIIYAVFVILYLGFNFLTRAQKLSSKEYQLNVLAELEEAVVHNLDKAEKKKISELLDASDQRSKITKELRLLVEHLHINASEQPSRLHTFFKKVDYQYEKFWRQRSSNTLIRLLFIGIFFSLISVTIYTIYNNIDDVQAIFDGSLTYGQELLIGKVAASFVAGGLVLYGLTKLRSSRAEAFEQFRRATLINIYLVQFFIFVRIQFEALPGLLLSIILLLLISFVIHQEKRLGDEHVTSE